MNYLIRLLAFGSVFVTSSSIGESKPDASGIKAKNLEGAKLDLMNDHDPASELENFALLEGFQANLFASEPMISNPVHMTWDARGRLWVACSWAYPQLKPGDKANDKIIILEDSDGDGRADKSTVFADGLYMPIGIMLSNGGVYVAQTPDVLFLKDTDGDDVADMRQVALTGFGIEDSHHSISAWRREPGGWIYFQEGIFLHTQIETQYGMVRNYNGGVYQFNPRTQELRVFANVGVGNPWGHVIDRWGQNFMVDNPRVIHLTPATGASGTKIRPTVLLSTDKQCGGDLISGGHFPPEMEGQLMTGRFKSRKVVRYEFIEKDSGFSANVLPPLIESGHPNFRPVDTKVGPDGAVYVADWYNSIINHAQHDFRDPRRDHEHGRIWRITHRERPLVERPNLIDADLGELLEQLKSPNQWTRHYAKLVLSERPDPDGVAKALRDWVAGLDPDEEGFDQHLVEVMWAMQNIERVDDRILLRVLNAKTGDARSAGARVIRYWHDKLADPVALIERTARDTFPRTRLEGILSAGFFAKADALPAALQALDHPTDPLIESALDQTIAALRDRWVPAQQAGELSFASPEHEAFALKGAGIGSEKRLRGILKAKKASPAEIRGITQHLVSNATAKELKAVAGTLASNAESFQPDLAVGLLRALRDVERKQKLGIGVEISQLAKLLDSEEDAIVIGALEALGVWKRADVGTQILAVVNDDSRSRSVRRAASVAIGELGRPEFVAQLREVAAGEEDIGDRYIAVAGLCANDLDEAAQLAAELFAFDPEENDPVAILSAFTGRVKGANAFAGALAGKDIHPVVKSVVAKHVRESGELPGQLGRVFQSRSATSLSSALIAEAPAKLVVDVDKLGNPSRGEMIYRRAELACTACHAIGGVGQKLGPDLEAVGAAATSEYIVESILHPNRAIAEHYENFAITTVDGAVRMGVIAFQSKTEIALRDLSQPDGERVIPRKQIKKMTGMPSMMPPNLVDQLGSRQEFLDLAKFVSLLGRPGAYAGSDAPVIRKWRVLPVDGKNADSSFPSADVPWVAAYSLVQGELPASTFGENAKVFVRGFVDVQVPGAVKLDINDSRYLRLWVNHKEIPEVTGMIDLPKGVCTLTFLVDQEKRGDRALRVKFETPAGSTAKYHVVGGI